MIPTLREVAACATPARGVIRSPGARSLASKGTGGRPKRPSTTRPRGEVADLALDSQATRSPAQGFA